MVLVCFTAVLCVVMQCFCCVMTQKTAVWTRLRIGGKRKKKSYFTLFFAFSATAEPGPRLEWYRISQIFQLVYASLSLVNSKLAFR